jgi:hypothetical protein
MKEALLNALRPVRTRQQTAFVLRATAAGLVVSAAAGLALGLARLFGLEISAGAAAGVLATGPVAGLLVGLIARRSWHAAAAAVDGHYGLKDRAVTALAFADQPAATDLHRLQIEEAMTHLARLEPKAVVPITAPRTLPVGAVGMLLAVGALLIPGAMREVEAGPLAAPENVVEAANDFKESAANIDKKIANATADMDDEKADAEKKGLKELFEKLLKKAEELSQPGMDEREALAKLAEMSADIQQQAKELNVELMDGQLGSLGTALAAAQAFEGAGKALMDGNLEKAAKELEKLEEPKITPKEAKALEEKLKELQKKMGEAGAGSLADAVGDLADGLKGGKGNVGKATKSIAKAVSNAAKRKKVRDLLLALDEDLKEGKGKVAAGQSGGPKGRRPEKSMNPSNTWGRGTSGNIEGEKTKLGSKRNEQQITGTPNEQGESEVETTATPEARQQAGRAYKEKYQKAKKESEAVLESEPLPLSHRSMIKKYFELIRPQGADMEKPVEEPKKDAPAAKPEGGQKK